MEDYQKKKSYKKPNSFHIVFHLRIFNWSCWVLRCKAYDLHSATVWPFPHGKRGSEEDWIELCKVDGDPRGFGRKCQNSKRRCNRLQELSEETRTVDQAQILLHVLPPTPSEFSPMPNMPYCIGSGARSCTWKHS